MGLRRGALERVYDEPHTVAYSNGGSVFLPVYESEDGLPVLGTLEFGVGGESMAFYGYADGAFDVLLEAEVQYPSAEGGAQPRYLLDGAEVTGDEYLADPLVSQFGTSEAYFLLDWPGAAGREGMHDVEETVALTEEALAELEGGAGA